MQAKHSALKCSLDGVMGQRLLHNDDLNIRSKFYGIRQWVKENESGSANIGDSQTDTPITPTLWSKGLRAAIIGTIILSVYAKTTSVHLLRNS